MSTVPRHRRGFSPRTEGLGGVTHLVPGSMTRVDQQFEEEVGAGPLDALEQEAIYRTFKDGRSVRICEDTAQRHAFGRLSSTPDDVQRLADRCYAVAAPESPIPSLHFKQVGTLLVVRVGHTALSRENEGNMVWFGIGGTLAIRRLLGQASCPLQVLHGVHHT